MSVRENGILFIRSLTLHYKMQQSLSVVLPSLILETPVIGNLEDLHKIKDGITFTTYFSHLLLIIGLERGGTLNLKTKYFTSL